MIPTEIHHLHVYRHAIEEFSLYLSYDGFRKHPDCIQSISSKGLHQPAVRNQCVHCFSRCKTTTRDTYRKAIELCFDWITSTGRQLGYMFPQDIIAYKDKLLKDNRSSLTVNLYLSVVRRFYKWTKANNLYPNIADGVASVKTNKKTFRKMHLENDEGAALLESVATTKKVTGKSSSHTKTLNANEAMFAKKVLGFLMFAKSQICDTQIRIYQESNFLHIPQGVCQSMLPYCVLSCIVLKMRYSPAGVSTILLEFLFIFLNLLRIACHNI